MRNEEQAREEAYDAADDVGGGLDVNDALVDAHLEALPSLGTLTARGAAGGDAEDLCDERIGEGRKREAGRKIERMGR